MKIKLTLHKDEYNRMSIMAALQSVDMVPVFDKDTPYDLIKIIVLDILVRWRLVSRSDPRKRYRLISWW